MKTSHLLLFFSLIFISLHAQNPKWITYNTSNSGISSNSVKSIAIDNAGNKWIGTMDGFAKFDGTNWKVYNKLNSGLPDNDVNSIAIDALGNKWIGTNAGLAKLADTTWRVYTSTNTELPNYPITAIVIDGSGYKWIGTKGGGLVKFNIDTLKWTVYNSNNSFLPDNSVTSLAIGAGDNWIGTWNGGLAKFDGNLNWTIYHGPDTLSFNYVSAIAIDDSGHQWIGAARGLFKFNGSKWMVYNTSDSSFPSDISNAIAIDGSWNKWIGTYDKGFVKFDGKNYTVYNTSNSGLPDITIQTIAIDKFGNKWIGTMNGGLAVYNEGGVVLAVEDIKNITPTEFSLSQNYPNPFNPSTSIQYSVISSQHVSLKVFNVLGKEIAVLVNEKKEPGTYTVDFSGTYFASGTYFYRLQAGEFVQTKKFILLK